MKKIISLRTRQNPCPTIKNGKVGPPTRRRNVDIRTREHLMPAEVERLIEAAGRIGRHPQRDRTLLLLMYRHGLRVSEAVALRWEAVDVKQGCV